MGKKYIVSIFTTLEKTFLTGFTCIILACFIAGCAGGPEILPQERVIYNRTVKAINKAKNEIKLAEDADAEDLMPKEYNKAKGYLATAETKLNEKKFSEAKEFADKASNEAKLSRNLPKDARNSVSNAILIVSSVQKSKLAKLFPDLIKSSEKDLQDARKCLDRNEFAMAKNYADKVINELGAKKNGFDKAEKIISEAEKEINSAKDSEADKYVQDEFDDATTALENAKTFLSNKDFDKANSNAEIAIKTAKSAKKKVPDMKKNLDAAISNEIKEVKNTLEQAKQTGAQQYALELLKIAELSISRADTLYNQRKLLEAKEASKKAKLDAENAMNKTNEEIAGIKAEEDAKKKAEEAAKLKAEEDAKKKTEEEAKKTKGAKKKVKKQATKPVKK